MSVVKTRIKDLIATGKMDTGEAVGGQNTAHYIAQHGKKRDDHRVDHPLQKQALGQRLDTGVKPVRKTSK